MSDQDTAARKDNYRRVYSGGAVLQAKLNVHTRYSTIPTDIPDAIAAQIGAPNGLAVLDVGCGTGHFLAHLSALRHRGRLVGVDLVPTPNGSVAGGTFVVGDVERLPFGTASFDVVTAVHMLSHLTDITLAMAEVRRMLVPGGRLVATVNSLHSYPHTARYRREVHILLGWGQPVFTTSVVNLENLVNTLRPYLNHVHLVTLTGELRIPQAEFPTYFDANIATWNNTPVPEQRASILRRVDAWSTADQIDGHIIEPKKVGIAICSDPIPQMTW